MDIQIFARKQNLENMEIQDRSSFDNNGLSNSFSDVETPARSGKIPSIATLFFPHISKKTEDPRVIGEALRYYTLYSRHPPHTNTPHAYIYKQTRTQNTNAGKTHTKHRCRKNTHKTTHSINGCIFHHMPLVQSTLSNRMAHIIRLPSSLAKGQKLITTYTYRFLPAREPNSTCFKRKP